MDAARGRRRGARPSTGTGLGAAIPGQRPPAAAARVRRFAVRPAAVEVVPADGAAAYPHARAALLRRGPSFFLFRFCSVLFLYSFSGDHGTAAAAVGRSPFRRARVWSLAWAGQLYFVILYASLLCPSHLSDFLLATRQRGTGAGVASLFCCHEPVRFARQPPPSPARSVSVHKEKEKGAGRASWGDGDTGRHYTSPRPQRPCTTNGALS